MHFKLITFSNDKCTVGNWYHDDELICHTMELPWIQNEKGISCIPAGLYNLKPRKSPSQGNTFYLENEKYGVSLSNDTMRTYIQIDVANKASELRGCIAVGSEFGIHTGEQCVINSKETKSILMELLGNESHTIEIKRF